MGPPRIHRRAFLQGVTGAFGSAFLARAEAAQRDRATGQERSPVLRQAIADASQKHNVPGIAAALIQNGELRGIEAFGVRDRGSNAPITPETIFAAGSLGEPIYAYAVLRLAAEGHFNAGAPLPSYLPPPYVRDLDPLSSLPTTEQLSDVLFNQVTSLRVMNHTSGLPEWARGQHLHFQGQPGQKWAYSNEAYIYLQHVVEHVTSESFEDFVTRETLRPARMPRASFVWRDAYTGEAATGYDPSGSPVEAPPYARPAATATLYASVREYAQFVRYLLASAPAQRTHESAVSLMLNPTISVPDAIPFSWGLGVGLEKSGADSFFFQRGKVAGSSCLALASRKSGTGIVVFANAGGGNGFDAVTDVVQATIGGSHAILQSAFVRGA